MRKSLTTVVTSVNWLRVAGWLLYGVVSYFLAMYAAAAIVWIVNLATHDVWAVQTTLGSLLLRCLIYAITLALLFAAFRYGPYKLSFGSVGLARSMNWRDIGYGVVGFLGYGLLTVGVLYVASQLPGFNANQTQDVGVTSVFGLERAAAFVVLVFIVPFCEELMFRGLLYGKLRQEKLPWWLAALVVSALFGLAHGQWNVGLDVFCLSIVACGLRELTGTIWAGVLVHIIKNFIAFALLFLVTS